MTTAIEKPLPTVAVMVTRRCNMACAHCSVESNSKIRAQPSDEDLERYVKEISDSGVKSILFTGGEPMLRDKLVVRLMAIAKKRGLVSAMTTNGFWGKSLPAARRTLANLCKSGLGFFTLSYDRYHAQFQGPEPGQNILRAAEELGLPMNLNVTRIADDTELDDLIKPFEASGHARVRFYDVQAVGRARDIPSTELRAETLGACDGAKIPTITDDGRVIACNGPSYFQSPESPLVLGSLKENPVSALLERHRTDPILQTVRIFGPSRLREELAHVPGVDFKWKESYAGLCDLCLHINSNPAAVTALRERLSDPKMVAERVARLRVMEGVASRGRSGRIHSIGPGSARVWMSCVRGETISRRDELSLEAERVFGRPDTDWTHISDYVSACGLSKVLLPYASDPIIARWAPALFRERLNADALREGRRELVQRHVLETIDRELTDMKADGVLLKGAAFLARDISASDPSRFPRRGGGDIDVVVSPAHAVDLWQRLNRRNGSEAAPGSRTGPHHLPPVFVNGMPVEIHTRIMPSLWRLPESEMLQRKERLPQFKSLLTLDAEGIMLHAMMHCASHVFGCGLKAAWDLAWALDRKPLVDVVRLKRWIDRCAMPAGFYVPAAVIKEVLDFPIPDELVDSHAGDSRFAALVRVLRQRMFIAMETTTDLNPFSKHGLFMLLHTSWTGRALHVSSLFGRGERESRASAKRATTSRSFGQQMRESKKQLDGFRFTLAAARRDALDERAAMFNA
ncbi:MAG TPA: radical SAM protein [Gemmatimonadaceae bacterium]